MEYLHGRKKEFKGKALAIGSAVHLILEKWFKQQPVDALDWVAIPSHERQAVIDYIETHCRSIYSNGGIVICVEGEYYVKWAEYAPPILLYLDLAHHNPAVEPGVVRIRDHKTNRNQEGVPQWLAKLQPRIYAFAARRVWGSDLRVIFEVGYVNFNQVLDFEVPIESDEQLLRDLETAWQRINAYSGGGNSPDYFPAKVGEACRDCVIKASCGEYRSQVEGCSFLEEASPVEKYVKAHLIKKIAETAMEEAKEAAIAEVDQQGGKVERELWTASISQRVERSVDAGKLLSTISCLKKAEREIVETNYSDLFTVKLGQLDKVAQVVPSLASAIGEITTKNPTLTFSVRHK
jgi:hypothetical protein